MKKTTKTKICPVYENCGGCTFQGVEYDKQLELKQERIDSLLSNFGHVEPIIGNINHLNYRNKVQVAFGKDNKGKIIVGNYVPSTHVIVPVKDCQIADKKANEIIETIRKLVVKYKISIFDEDTYKGCIRHVQIRCGNSKQYMVILVTGTSKIYKGDLLIKDLLAKYPEIKTIVQSINNKHTSMILGDKNIVLYGSGYIRDKLCGLDFSLSPTAFYQVNKYQTEVLYETALNLADLKGDERVIDAYCGIGTISLLLSKRVKEVLGVEINFKAIRDAKFNAKLNNINNVSFIADDAGRFMSKTISKHKEKIDVVCMDPPRNGADDKFLSSLVTLSPKKIIYISCGPDSLRSNLFYLTKNGYHVDKIQPVDMFPYTDHVETIVILSKSEKSIKQLNKNKFNINHNKVGSLALIICIALLSFKVSGNPTNNLNASQEHIYNLKTNEYETDLSEEIIADEDAKTSKINFSFSCVDEGYDIYTPGRTGYRYGPSIIKYDDGSLDVWFSSPGNNSSEWDYIRYRHMDSDGIWSQEKIVLRPTSGSLDHYSVCDPAVIYFNGYYYLSYTSTDSSNQMNNSVFVARSQNPDGPFEKWNGSGWGGSPSPIVYYDLQDDSWGAGEASFVIKDDTLYIYYSWLAYDGYTTRVLTASLDENWPNTIEDKGVALNRICGEDSLDVVYVEGIDKFVAFANVYKMTDNSGIGVYVSDDGLSFRLTDIVRNDIMSFSHNLGVSKGLDGHIKYDDELILGYAYSQDQATISWGRWATRFQNIKLNIFIGGD